MVKLKKPILVITAPSAGGKATIAEIIKRIYARTRILPSVTTRAPKNETHGKEYAHVTHREFENLIQAGAFAEYNKYPSATAECGYHYYGTLKDTITDFLQNREEDELAILDVDINGALDLKKFNPDILVVSLVVEREERKIRMDKRGTESEAEKIVRLDTGDAEMQQVEIEHENGLVDQLVPYGVGADPDLTGNKVLNYCF